MRSMRLGLCWNWRLHSNALWECKGKTNRDEGTSHHCPIPAPIWRSITHRTFGSWHWLWLLLNPHHTEEQAVFCFYRAMKILISKYFLWDQYHKDVFHYSQLPEAVNIIWIPVPFWKHAMISLNKTKCCSVINTDVIHHFPPCSSNHIIIGNSWTSWSYLCSNFCSCTLSYRQPVLQSCQ